MIYHYGLSSHRLQWLSVLLFLLLLSCGSPGDPAPQSVSDPLKSLTTSLNEKKMIGFDTLVFRTWAFQMQLSAFRVAAVPWYYFDRIAIAQINAGSDQEYFDIANPPSNVFPNPVRYYYYGYFEVYVTSVAIVGNGRVKVEGYAYRSDGTIDSIPLWSTNITPAGDPQNPVIISSTVPQIFSLISATAVMSGVGSSAGFVQVRFNGYRIIVN